jgi:hypothetical protein
LDTLDGLLNESKNDPQDKKIMDWIKKSIETRENTFVFTGKWTTSTLIPTLSPKAKQYLSVLSNSIAPQKNPKNLSRYCTGDYNVLAPYLNGINIDLIEFEDEQDMIKRLPESYQLLGKQFFRSVVDRINIVRNPHYEPEITRQITHEDITDSISNDSPILDYSRRKVISSKFQSFRGNSIDVLANACKTTPKNNSVRTLKLTDCGLVDEDMDYVLQISDAFPKCRDIDLSSNRFHGFSEPLKDEVDLKLKELLDRGIRVNLTINAIASVDRLDLFESLTDKQLRKLIWILENHLKGPGWKILISDKERQAIVNVAHQNYYDEARI